MASELFARHEGMLRRTIDALSGGNRRSPFPESPRAYDETAPAEGEERFNARLGRRFELDQPRRGYQQTGERSPYGVDLDVAYPIADCRAMVEAASGTLAEWGRADEERRIGVCLEILHRLGERTFELAHAVMQTTGQPFLAAFQTGGPHALDRGLDAVSRAHLALTHLPPPTRWEAPQGGRETVTAERTWHPRPRGVAVTLGASTFPTWHAVPGLFASLATGNPVIVKPHPGSVLPLAMVVETAREVLVEDGFDPAVVQLAVDSGDDPIAERLATHPAVAIVDYAGGPRLGRWIEAHAVQARCFTEIRGVNAVVVDAVPDLKGTSRTLAMLAATYSGQACTSPHVVFVPRDGIEAEGGHVSFREVAEGVASALEGLLADDRRASDILGAIRRNEVLAQIETAASGGEVLLASRRVVNPTFPGATVATPLVVAVDATARHVWLREISGPVLFVVATDGTAHSLALATEAARTAGALVWMVAATDPEVEARAEEAALDAGVSLALGISGRFSANQAAAVGDLHPTGATPAGNASPTDPGFVTGRFHLVATVRPV